MGRRQLMVLILAAAIIGPLGVASPASAYVLIGCKWTSGAPTVNYHNLGGVTFSSEINNAASTWSGYTDVNMYSNTGSTLGVYYQNNGASGYAGLTPMACSGGSILHAEPRINIYYTNSYSTGKRKAVWVHELGHALGINHAPGNVIMNQCPPCLFDSVGYNWPTTDDVAGINYLY